MDKTFNVALFPLESPPLAARMMSVVAMSINEGCHTDTQTHRRPKTEYETEHVIPPYIYYQEHILTTFSLPTASLLPPLTASLHLPSSLFPSLLPPGPLSARLHGCVARSSLQPQERPATPPRASPPPETPC